VSAERVTFTADGVTLVGDLAVAAARTRTVRESSPTSVRR
jgi:hypothetical protein